jgi:hypothetical protein
MKLYCVPILLAVLVSPGWSQTSSGLTFPGAAASSNSTHFGMNAPGFPDTSDRGTQPALAPVRSTITSSVPYMYPVGPSRLGASGSGKVTPRVPYMLSFKDKTVDSALTYWIDGHTLHYLNLSNESRSLPAKRVDWNATARMNQARASQSSRH